IAQWSAGGRWDSDTHDNVVWYASTKGASPWSLDVQLEFIWYELTTFGYGLSELRGSPNVSDATADFAAHYEICGECDESNRVDYAEHALSAWGTGSKGGGGGGGGGGGSSPDACSEGDGFCTATLQCDSGHWIVRQDDPASCTTVKDVDEACHEGDGYCTETLQCDRGNWVPRTGDPDACTSGAGG
ncbi:MAG TPA: phage tail tip lysozyme, partial [Acidimicrobiales bacterium]